MVTRVVGSGDAASGVVAGTGAGAGADAGADAGARPSRRLFTRLTQKKGGKEKRNAHRPRSAVATRPAEHRRISTAPAYDAALILLRHDCHKEPLWPRSVLSGISFDSIYFLLFFCPKWCGLAKWCGRNGVAAAMVQHILR